MVSSKPTSGGRGSSAEQRRDRLLGTFSILIALAVLATACSEVSSTSGEPQALISTTTAPELVEFGNGSTLSAELGSETGPIEFGAGGSVEVIPTTGVITVERNDEEAPPLDSHLDPLGYPVRIESTELVDQVTLTFPLPAIEDGHTVAMHYHDDELERWIPVETEVDPGSGTAQVVVDHLSWWNPFSWCVSCFFDKTSQAVGLLLGNRVSPPTCDGEPPSWFKQYWDGDAASAPFVGCVESEGSTLVLRVANNRPYGVVVTSPEPFAWSALDHAVPLNDIVRGAADVGLGEDVADWMYIPPTTTASIGFDRPDDRASWVLTAQPNSFTLMLDVMTVGFEAFTSFGAPQDLAVVAATVLVDCGIRPAVETTVPGMDDLISLLRELGACLADIDLEFTTADFANGMTTQVDLEVARLLSDLFILMDVAEFSGKFADLLADLWVAHDYGWPLIGLVPYGQAALRDDGIGPVTIGQEWEQAAEALEQRFGPYEGPDLEVDPCRGDPDIRVGYLRWANLVVNIEEISGAGRIMGYAYGQNLSDPLPAHSIPTDLTTAEGIGLHSTAGDLRVTHPDVWIDMEHELWNTNSPGGFTTTSGDFWSGLRGYLDVTQTEYRVPEPVPTNAPITSILAGETWDKGC